MNTRTTREYYRLQLQLFVITLADLTPLSPLPAAMFHPLEFYCLPALVVYYITVPSMYFLLIVYSFTNMNNVTWGTREVAVKTRKTKEVRDAAESPSVRR